MKSVSASVLLLLVCAAGVAQASDSEHSNILCPRDENFSQTCLDAILPPFPICMGKTPAEWVAKAEESATRCCKEDGDLSECKCPVKDSAPFQAKIGDHCKAVTEDCKSSETVTPTDDSDSDSDQMFGLCPKGDENVSQACLDAILPPFPICMGKTPAEWVAHAQDAATRCCKEDGDLSECKCPVKDSEPFQGKIGDYCKAVAVAGECVTKPSLTAAAQEANVVGNNLRGAFDMEKQMQREEYTP